MINNKKLIEQAISEINSLSFEDIKAVINELDQEEILNSKVLETKAKYIENKQYFFNSAVFDYKTVHKKNTVFDKIFKKKEKNENEMLEVA